MKGARTDVLLAVLRKAVSLLFAVPAVPIFDRANGDGEHYCAVVLHHPRSVADRAASPVSNRPADSRRRTAIPSEEKRHTHDGWIADLRLNRGADAAVVEFARAFD